MHICPNCQHTSETPVAFCAHCGTAMVEQVIEVQPVAEQPVAAPVEAPVYQPPVEVAAPAYQPPVEVAAPAYQPPAPPAYQPPVQPPVVAYQQPVQPEYQPPAYQQPVQPAYQQPVQPAQPMYSYAAEPVAEEPSKGKTITGMILSIAGVALSSYFFLMVLGLAESAEMGAGMGLVFSFFTIPLSLIGLLLSKNGTHTMNKVGKILGIVGLALSGTMFLFPLLAAIGESPEYYY